MIITCDHCNEFAECQLIVDPFMNEVYPEDGPYEPTWYCAMCAEIRRDNI